MNQVLVYGKAHWKGLAGAFFGLLVLYYLYEKLAGGSGASASSDVSGGGATIQGLSAAASLQNAQVNGQVEVAQIQGAVAAAGIQASLANSLELTRAQLEATNNQTAAGVAVALGQQATDITTQKLVSEQAVQQTAIQGATLDQLERTQGQTEVQIAGIQAAVSSQMIATVGKQIQTIQSYSKHASQDYKAIAPIIAIETGQGYVAPGIANANAATDIAKSPGATITAVGTAAKGVGSLLAGLFG